MLAPAGQDAQVCCSLQKSLNFNGSTITMKHQFPTPHPAKKRRTQSVIPVDAWSIIASFLPISEQFSLLYTSRCIQQTALNNVLQDIKNTTILFQESIRQGRVEVVRLLLSENRVDPSYDDDDAIQSASDNGHIEVVRLLLSDNRVDPSTYNNFAIQSASSNGHVEVVRLLLSDNRVDLSDQGNSAIRLASSNGHVEVVRLLLSDNRVDPSDCGNFAIQSASSNGHVEVVRLLLSDNRVDPSIIKKSS
jgi:ankyrin repeat protein